VGLGCYGDSMFTKQEKEYLKTLVKHQLEMLQKENKTIIENPAPQFVAAEEQFQHFFEGSDKKNGIKWQTIQQKKKSYNRNISNCR